MSSHAFRVTVPVADPGRLRHPPLPFAVVEPHHFLVGPVEVKSQGRYLLVQPVGAVALGAVVLGQYPSPTQLCGVLVVVAGVLVATAGPRGLPRPLVRRARAALGPGPMRSGEPVSALVD